MLHLRHDPGLFSPMQINHCIFYLLLKSDTFYDSQRQRNVLETSKYEVKINDVTFKLPTNNFCCGSDAVNV